MPNLLRDETTVCPICDRFYSFVDTRVTRTIGGIKINYCLSCTPKVLEYIKQLRKNARTV